MKKKSISLFLAIFMALSLCTSAFAAEDKPSIHGKAAVTMDMDTGEIIYSKSIDSKMYPASTTKLITALLLAENKHKGDLLKYTKAAKAQPEYSINLNLHSIDVGETMSAEDVMDGLLLFSGNDIAYVIADNVAGDESKFADLMNEKIKSLGLKNTHFVTPNGLHDPDHYTTAYDLTVIGREAFKNPWVKESMNKETSTVKTSKGTTVIVENRNKLLGKDDCIGGKTGYTAKAGRCLVAIFDRDGRKIIGVVMNSIYDRNDSFVFNDMKKIIDWSYDAKKTPLYPKNSIIATEKLTYKPLVFFGPTKTIDVPILAKADISFYNNEINKKEMKKDFNIQTKNIWKINDNKSIGTLTISEREAKQKYDLYTNISKSSIMKANILLYVISVLTVLVGILLIVGGIKAIKKRKNRKRRSKYL
ncbi:D-alanyl-D-alanine carboxypeptidase [Clostridium tetanomorphum]|uniref:D-alanyl-D-alanine carboxypeptidase family protein n=1 Tax=Clostridium tetanomorphum TaxID=1553 RepID=UPI000452CEB5|nr:D-alanyl-D-alanine carboxypeptidase [Clostridium tetanomorphum DSM 665]KAJ51440.1 D-alanyl-D-alanine carboxypeptidase [Clostridium tetanomorphum DSM 665]MBP1863859.1 D-alanyl-D-alanine carboxypeptidase [Clostridium tetanomorphum]NRS84937.1 D-alanyl-D-alanine carboxypeptidase [Clostridium tetanomorphum]SQB91543.1 D-alanyl-D-alanine carboxypeptidase [Clostridium tetanomorphum]